MIYLGIVVFCIILFCSPALRCAVFHPFKVVFYSVKDAVFYVLHKDYNLCPTGELVSFNAHFGGGKTLSAVKKCTVLYKAYNNKKVWDRDKHKFVLQKVCILSNVEFRSVPSEALTSLSQVVNYAFQNKKIDADQDTRTVLLVLIDESSSQLNSRNFKTNIDPEFLNALITCRHFHMNLYYTSQKFKLTDALLRSVTQTCIHCNKRWRFLTWTYYNADEVEVASDLSMIRPLARKCFFVLDKDFSAYDTLATVGNLKKTVERGEMLSESEILSLRGQLNPDNDQIKRPSRKLRRLRRKS